MSLLFNKSFYTILLGNRILSDANGQKANVLCDMGIMGNNTYKINICTSNVLRVAKRNCESNGNTASRFCFLT